MWPSPTQSTHVLQTRIAVTRNLRWKEAKGKRTSTRIAYTGSEPDTKGASITTGAAGLGGVGDGPSGSGVEGGRDPARLRRYFEREVLFPAAERRRRSDA